MSVPRFSVRVRLFVATWLLCGLHFATNVVREHYPAFALVAHGNLRCDDWAGLSPDLFQHSDGHWYANHQVGASLAAVPVLFVLEPLLHGLEEIGKRQAAERDRRIVFDSEYPLRAKFMASVFARGLHLRFGAAAAATALFVMAPCAGLLALLMHALLVRRGVAEPRAATLALLSIFATPVLFRSAILNHNQLEAVAAFAAFCVLRCREPTGAARCCAGLLAGTTLLLDASGAVLVLAFALEPIASGWRRAGWRGALHDLLTFGAGVLPPVAVLMATQFASFGDPFLPAQYWMPATKLSSAGWHGITPPNALLLVQSLFDPSYGLFAFAPLLLVALLPARAKGDPPAQLLSRSESRFILFLVVAFLLFNAMNRFTGLQWNTGFRSLAPLVPFLFLVACDRLARLSSWTLALVATPALMHAWVVALARATPPVEPHSFAESTLARSWLALFRDGLQLPWVTVWRKTQAGGGPAWAGFVSSALIAGLGVFLVAFWRSRRPVAARIDPTKVVAP